MGGSHPTIEPNSRMYEDCIKYSCMNGKKLTPDGGEVFDVVPEEQLQQV